MESKMTSEQFAGIARALIAAFGGFLVGKGYLDTETAATLGGAVTTLSVAVWSVWSKKRPA
jgi:uncharacterized membrane protein